MRTPAQARAGQDLTEDARRKASAASHRVQTDLDAETIAETLSAGSLTERSSTTSSEPPSVHTTSSGVPPSTLRSERPLRPAPWQV